MGEKYLIESMEHTHGSHKAWWCPDRLGYTANVNEAGRYSEEEAASICAKGKLGGQVNERMWRERDVLDGEAGKLALVVSVW